MRIYFETTTASLLSFKKTQMIIPWWGHNVDTLSILLALSVVDSQHSGSMMQRFYGLLLAWTSSWTNRWMKDNWRCYDTWVTSTIAVYCHFNVFVQEMPIILGLATRVMPVLCNPLTWVLNINGQRLSPCGILLGQDKPDCSMLLAHKPGVWKAIINT